MTRWPFSSLCLRVGSRRMHVRALHKGVRELLPAAIARLEKPGEISSPSFLSFKLVDVGVGGLAALCAWGCGSDAAVVQPLWLGWHLQVLRGGVVMM